MAKIKGPFQFANKLTKLTDENIIFPINVNFTCNGVSYVAFTQEEYMLEYMKDESGFNDKVYFDSWVNQNYRLLDFGEAEQDINDAFYDWLMSQEDVFTIKRTTLKAIADVIREKTDSQQDYTALSMPEGVERVYACGIEEGKKQGSDYPSVEGVEF